MYSSRLKEIPVIKQHKKSYGLMFGKDLMKMIKTFKKTSFFEVKSVRWGKSIASMSVEDVAIALQKGTSSGIQTCSARGIP